MQLWPHRHGTDAMFCALLRRPVTVILGLIAVRGRRDGRRLRRELAAPRAERGWQLAITVTPTAARWLASAGELAGLRR